MKLPITALLGLLLVSCTNVHQAIVPLTDPAGSPVAVVVPGVDPEGEPKKSQIVGVAEGLIEHFKPDDVSRKYLPGFVKEEDSFGLVVKGPHGTLATKNGKKFYGYAPFISVAATAPAADVERAATLIAADVYRSAKKRYQIYPQSALKKLGTSASAPRR